MQTYVVASPKTIIFKNVQHTGHLAEDKNAGALCLQLG